MMFFKKILLQIRLEVIEFNSAFRRFEQLIFFKALLHYCLWLSHLNMGHD